MRLSSVLWFGFNQSNNNGSVSQIAAALAVSVGGFFPCRLSCSGLCNDLECMIDFPWTIIILYRNGTEISKYYSSNIKTVHPPELIFSP
jgi:hypothetical protein